MTQPNYADLVLQEGLEQPLWLPPRFGDFVLTYRHDADKPPEILCIYYFQGGERDAVEIRNFIGLGKKLEIRQARLQPFPQGYVLATGMEFYVLQGKRRFQGGYKEGMLSLFNGAPTDGVLFNGEVPDSYEDELAHFGDFAGLYFEHARKETVVREEAPTLGISVVKPRLVLPGDPRFR